jgi:hypothetical protein
MLDNDPVEFYEQRGHWFLLLGALLGGIVTLALAIGFGLQEWGHHITPDPGDRAYQIEVGFAVGFVVAVIVIALLVWRALYLLRQAHKLATPVPSPVPASEPVAAAVAAWTAAALHRPHGNTGDDRQDPGANRSQ